MSTKINFSWLLQAANNKPSFAGQENQTCISTPCSHMSQYPASAQAHKLIAQSKGLNWHLPTKL